MSTARAALSGVDWNSLRRKGWHALLMLGSAYATTDPRVAWAVPVLTGMAGVSAPPGPLGRLGAIGAVLVAALLAGLLSV